MADPVGIATDLVVGVSFNGMNDPIWDAFDNSDVIRKAVIWLVPDFWEVSGDNSSGKVTYYGQEKARIVYHAASYKRIVERLEWLDDKGQVVMVEHYDQYGRKIAVTTCGDQGQYLVTTYFEGDTERFLKIRMGWWSKVKIKSPVWWFSVKRSVSPSK